jgi:CBS domain-containing protein
MTINPITVGVDTPLTEVVQRMTDAPIHRVLAVDRLSRLVGIISNTDLLAEIVHADRAGART